jgi:hypothetical protein
MHEIQINVNTKDGFHPPKIVILKDNQVLIDMPADEFIGWVETVRSHQEKCRECEVSGCPEKCLNCGSAHHVGLCLGNLPNAI